MGFIILVPILVRDYLVDPISGQFPRLKQEYDYVREMIFGLLIVLSIIWEPAGLYRLWARVKGEIRSWPLSTGGGEEVKPGLYCGPSGLAVVEAATGEGRRPVMRSRP